MAGKNTKKKDNAKQLSSLRDFIQENIVELSSKVFAYTVNPKRKLNPPSIKPGVGTMNNY